MSAENNLHHHQTTAEQLVGTWRLVNWEFTLDGSFHSHPFGADAKGRISYGPDGTMSAILMRADRAAIDAPSLAAASDIDKVSVVSGYVSYAGRYRVEDNHVFHAVEFSLFPNWIGTDLVRKTGWVGASQSDLLLETAPVRSSKGQVAVNHLRWRRV